MKNENEFLKRFVEILKNIRYLIILVILLVIIFLIPYLAK